jgi:putative peptide maturation dehydrogenase
MPRVRRTRYLFFYCQDEPVLDVGLLLRGVAEPGSVQTVYALSILTRAKHAVTTDELELVVSLPADRWVEADSADDQTLCSLAEKGLLVTDREDDEWLAELRRRDEQLSSGEWNAYAALYHFMTRWSGYDLRVGLAENGEPLDEIPPLTREEIQMFVALHGEPPSPFRSVEAPLAVRELPVPAREDGLFGALRKRMTTRGFDRRARMSLDELALVLYYVWGCHGYVPMLPGLPALKRTSPSGGGLHPIEVYPLVSNVDGLDTGLYHYNVRDHSLELLEGLARDEATKIASKFVCGQTFFGSAHVAFIMTARFYRSFWKYRRHQKAYAAVLMDVAHLSQTLYLVSAELGLGAFVTAAVNGEDVDERLGLDGYGEGTLAIAGCGKRLARLSRHEPRFIPYVPRETAL